MDFDISQFDGFNLGVIGSPMIYARFAVWSDLFDDFETVVYLDCDTIVLREFSELFQMHEFFGVSDYTSTPLFVRGSETTKNCLLSCVAMALIFKPLIRQCLIADCLWFQKKYRSRAHLEHILDIKSRYDDYILHSDQSVISFVVPDIKDRVLDKA